MCRDHDKTHKRDSRAPADRLISRREFLKMTGAAGAVAALGSVSAACEPTGDAADTTATIVAAQATTSTTEPTSTTVVSGPEVGRELRLGVVSAITGPLGLFGKADEWWTEFALEALPEGIVCGDGRQHKIVVTRADSRSDPERAAKAAEELISVGRADMIMCSGGAELVNPVADQAEARACPCLCSFVHWRPFFFSRGATREEPFRWTYAHAVGLEDIAANYLAMWGQLPTNKKVGFVFADDARKAVWADADTGLTTAVAAAGYEYVLPTSEALGAGDYAEGISEFIRNGCEILCVAMPTADFIALWDQCLQQDYRPKIVTVAEGLIFPQALEAMGPAALNLTAECLWQPDWPYRDSVTGKSCQELADDYEAQTGEQWIAAIAQYAKFEWAVDVFKRVRHIDSADAIVAAMKTTKVETCLGLIDFTAPIDADDVSDGKRPVENVCKAPVGGVQWVKGDAFAYEQKLVSDANSPALRVAGRLAPMVYE